MLDFEKRVQLIHRSLGIPAEYENDYGLVPQIEAVVLVEIENDVFGRPQRLIPEAASSWRAMKAQAQEDGIILSVVSAFRSIEKQTEIIRKKIETGQFIQEILKVCAAPGYSEHHTGRAIDITSNNCDPLTEIFEKTPAFQWLQENARFHSFKLSYPKDNQYGIAYEPWHWAYHPEQKLKR